MPDYIKITHQPIMNLPDDEWVKKPNESIPPSNANIRAQFLKEVEKLVCADRNVTHGDAEDNFTDIANLWNTYLGPLHIGSGPAIDNKDVAVMMCLFKVSRLMSNRDNLENWLDLAGYAACGGGIVKKELDNF